MKVIITGGAGFIGSHLANLSLQEGARVIVIDNLVNGRMGNIESHLSHTQFQFVKEDVCHTQAIEKYFQDVDYIFHLAALADIVPSINRPLDYHRANVEGTLSILEIARKHRIKKLEIGRAHV